MNAGFDFDPEADAAWGDATRFLADKLVATGRVTLDADSLINRLRRRPLSALAVRSKLAYWNGLDALVRHGNRSAARILKRELGELMQERPEG